MALAIGRKADHVRVLSDLSGLVVGALLDDAENGPESDAFADALRRYREEGAPQLDAAWRRAIPSTPGGARAAEVLRHLTRDLLKGLSMSQDRGVPDASVAAEAPPPNVRAIDASREVPALELASDGTWKPSGSSLAAQEEIDASALRRNVPSARSRYPQVSRGERLVLPPAPKRFTEITVPAAPAPAAPAPAVVDEATVPSLERPAPVPDAPILRAPEIEHESIIRAVAGGIEVVAGPFARFQELAAFVKALRALSGVQDVTTRQFVRGMVHLRVRHSQTTALADRLLELAEFRPTLVSSTLDRIELKVDIAE